MISEKKISIRDYTSESLYSIGTEAVYPCRRDFQNRLKLQPIVPTKALRTNVLLLKGTCQIVAMLALPGLLVGQAHVRTVLCADVLPGRDVHLDVATLCPTKSLPPRIRERITSSVCPHA